MRCDEAQDRLLEMMEEELPPERRVEVLSHLQACAACATESSAYRDLLVLVQADPVPEPSPHFWEQFLPSLKQRIEQEAPKDTRKSAAWLVGLQSWFALRRPFIAGVAVAAASILIVLRLPGLLSIRADWLKISPPAQQSAGRGGDSGNVAMTPRSGEPYVVAGEIVEDPSALAAAIQRLPWVDEILNRVETAWVMRPEADPEDWLASLSEEEHQVVLDRLRSFQWSLS